MTTKEIKEWRKKDAKEQWERYRDNKHLQAAMRRASQQEMTDDQSYLLGMGYSWDDVS